MNIRSKWTIKKVQQDIHNHTNKPTTPKVQLKKEIQAQLLRTLYKLRENPIRTPPILTLFFLNLASLYFQHLSEQLVEALHTTYPMGYTIPYGCVIDNSVAINCSPTNQMGPPGVCLKH